MRDAVSISILPEKTIVLQSISWEDQGVLRNWKNNNRHSFFFQGAINEKQQKQWFEQYLNNQQDQMFVVRYDGERIGCLGFRIISNTADIYNVILGEIKYRRQGIMSQSLRALFRYILDLKAHLKICLKNLRSNEVAEQFYSSIGFQMKAIENDYFLMEMDHHFLQSHPVEIQVMKTKQ